MTEPPAGAEREIGIGLRVADADEGARHVAYFKGDLDLGNVDDFMKEVCSIAERVAPTELVLDLSGVDFIDSKGVAALAGAELQARGAGVRALHLRRPSPTVERVLSLTSVMEHLPMLRD